ncbi:MAG: DMT family transporter [Verrucomicrobia bacterium]|nr:DMT family transporter [Verrucomicrobiota bacterium]
MSRHTRAATCRQSPNISAAPCAHEKVEPPPLLCYAATRPSPPTQNSFVPDPVSSNKGAFKYELLLLLMSMIWGSAFVAQQIGMEKGLGPMTFNGLRFALGSICLFPVIIWRKKNLTSAAGETKLPYRGSVGAGVFLFSAAALQQIGLQFTSSAHSGFITAFYILFVPLLGIFFRHRAPKILWLGILICLIGFYFLSVTGNFVVSKGDWLTLMGAVLWAGHILVIDHAANKGDPVCIACIQFAVCAILSALAGLIFEHVLFSQIRAAFGAIVYTGIMSIGVGYTLQVICQKHCPPAPAAIIMSLESVFAALAGYLVLNQTLSSRALMGCGLILSGVILVQLMPMMRKNA